MCRDLCRDVSIKMSNLECWFVSASGPLEGEFGEGGQMSSPNVHPVHPPCLCHHTQHSLTLHRHILQERENTAEEPQNKGDIETVHGRPIEVY